MTELDPTRCLCGHGRAQHHPPDSEGLTWCTRCGCSTFELAEKRYSYDYGEWSHASHAMSWRPKEHA